jgi:hypothetical protein|tara:strand:+ start:177 stop:557 length:381 start_codon:yes stop_codon:yes gene_type:complete
MKIYKNYYLLIVLILLLTGCVELQKTPGKKGTVLAEYPVGVHVRRLSDGLFVYFGRFEVTVKNNSGRFIDNLSVTIYLYDKNDMRIDDETVYFSNLNSGEALVKTSRGANRDGRPWSRFTTRYKIY